MSSKLENCQIFDNLCYKLNCLVCERNEKSVQHLNSVLNELNAFNYRIPIVTDYYKAILSVHQLCTIILPSDSIDLIEKCCQFIVNLITLQHIAIQGRTLSFVFEWVLSILKQTKRPNVLVLRCLDSLIRDNVDKIEDLCPNIVGPTGVLTKYAQIKSDQQIQFWIAKCLETLIYFNEENAKNTIIKPLYLESCLQVFMRMLTEGKETNNSDELIFCKLLISCLRGMRSIVLREETEMELGLLLGVSRCYMTYFLYETDSWFQPQKIHPTNLTVADLKITNVCKEKKGGKILKQRKQRKSNHKKDEDKRVNSDNKNNSNYTPAIVLTENSNVVVSDSDFSDSETGRVNKVVVMRGRVRQAALNLLLLIVKTTDKHTMFGYWSSFFSDGSPTSIRNLNQCLLAESSPRGRIAVLNVMSNILNGSKLYLSQAETSEKSFAFTPFSTTLGLMVQELHKCLCSGLKNNSVPVLTQILKCLALLVQATPYHRLTPGLISTIIQTVRPFIRHRDPTIQVAALIVLGCVVVSEPIDETINQLLINYKHENVSTSNETELLKQSKSEDYLAEFSSSEEENDADQEFTSNDHLPWLLEKCVRNLGQTVPAPVKMESLQLLSALCQNYYRVYLAPNLMQVCKVLEMAMDDKYSDLRLHAGRAVDSIGNAMQHHIASLDEPKNVYIDKGVSFWQNLINGPLASFIQNETHVALRAIACDCLATIGPDIYEHLPKDKQILIITLLFACSHDEENSVKGAAVRALAISVLYPSLREDLGFIMDTAEAIVRTLNDSNVTVRIKSSWALGNLSDALVLYKNDAKNEDLPDSLIEKLLLASIKVAEVNNKIRSNVTRALGGLLRLVTIDLFNRDNYKRLVEDAITLLVQNATKSPIMKVRWNSCYALANCMKNNDLFVGGDVWQCNVYTALIDLVTNFHNFKVRINAALAFSVPEKRTHYGNYYFLIWKALLDALDSSQNIEDFSEFKHRDNLVDQICLSICHLTNFLTPDDLNTLNEIAVSHLETLKLHMYRVHERLVPEKSEILIKTGDYVVSLQKEGLSNEDVDFIDLLKHVFICEYSL